MEEERQKAAAVLAERDRTQAEEPRPSGKKGSKVTKRPGFWGLGGFHKTRPASHVGQSPSWTPGSFFVEVLSYLEPAKRLGVATRAHFLSSVSDFLLFGFGPF